MMMFVLHSDIDSCHRNPHPSWKMMKAELVTSRRWDIQSKLNEKEKNCRLDKHPSKKLHLGWRWSAGNLTEINSDLLPPPTPPTDSIDNVNWDFRHTKDGSIIIITTVNEDFDKLRKSPKKKVRRPLEYLQRQQTDRLSRSRVDPPINSTAEGSIASELTHAGTIFSSRCVFVNHSLAHPGKVSSRPGSNARGFVNHNKTIT